MNQFKEPSNNLYSNAKLPLQGLALQVLVCIVIFFSFSHLVNAASTEKPDEEMRQLLHQTIQEADSFKDRFDAEVWLVDMDNRLKRYMKDPEERFKFLKLVHQEAKRVELQPELVLSVIHVESLFDRFAISRVGAQGLMQVMPFWRKEIGTDADNLMDMTTNIRYGCTILKAYLKREKGNLIRALARYNGSLGKTWYPERVFNAWEKYWFVNHK
ncbi:MAG: lytic transglycosylase domain-containing protein [Pseudomonadales bacterium]|nr:lytic transglycosylase domain-containing protein [Pseudomonadales bacterium]